MIDPHSETWRSIKTQVQDRIEQSRFILEANGLSIEETQFIRGRIAAMKELLTMTDPKPVILSDQPYT